MKLVVVHHDDLVVAYRSQLISDYKCSNKALKNKWIGRRLSNRIGNLKLLNRVGNLKCPNMEESLKIYE